MKTIGLVGGVASGKSLAARLLVEQGAGLLDADRAGHAVLAEDADVEQQLRDRWGDAAFAADGSIDRSAVARRVFADGSEAASERKFLENVLHPRIGQRLEQLREEFAAEGCPAVVLDAPLLLEAGWRPLCDLVVMVDASRGVRLARAQSRGWDETEFTRREAAQWPVDEKRRAADIVVKNDGSEDELRAALREIWRKHVRED